MSDKKTPSISEIQDEILGEIKDLNQQERFEYIIDSSHESEPLDAEFKTEANRVIGCVSQVWLRSWFQDGKVYFQGDSDSLFVAGLVALVIRVYSGHSPDEIAKADPNFLMESGLIRSLSVSRGNGAAAMLRRVFREANHYAHLDLLKKT
jgi:cysteine desulfuration protein SufE